MITTTNRLRAGPVQRMAGAMAILTIAIGLLLLAITYYSASRMDAEMLDRQQELLDNSFTSRLARSVGELRSVAWWDDAVKYTDPATFDRAWLDREIGSYMVESYKHDRIVVLNEDNRPIYAFGGTSGIGTPQLTADLTAANDIIAQVRGGPDASPRIRTSAAPGALYEQGEFANRKYSRGFGALLTVNSRPTLATALLITPSFDTSKISPKRRIVMSFIDVTDTVLKVIGRDTLMPDLGFSMRRDRRAGSFMLKTDRGVYLADLRWTPERPGTEMLRSILPYIIAALIASTAMLVILLLRLLRSTRDLTEREHEAQRLANHDTLTELPNRRMLNREFVTTARNAFRNDELLIVACIDVDRFKDVNDTLGHHAGDQLIKGIARRLRHSLPRSDFVARVGGDEFAILRRCDDPSECERMTDLIKACLDEPFAVQGQLIGADVSIGVTLSGAERSFDQMLREADIALYEAKARGRACGVRYEPAMGYKIERRRALEVDLRKAIANRELTVVYQPIVEAATGQIASVEALVRWTSARHGSIGPDVFIPIAEEAGLMAEIGRFVIDKAVDDARRWPMLETAINISPAQLRSATILHDLIGPTERYGVAPAKITIEITESILMGNDERTMRTLNVLKQRGFSLALDDFGTGYSSLAYLRDFPFDKLKIDRSFIKNLGTSERALQIVEAVANFGRILGREIVAEGIETEQEMQAMQRVGCTHLQGFLFSKPQSAGHIEVMAAKLGRLSPARDDTNLAARPILRRV